MPERDSCAGTCSIWAGLVPCFDMELIMTTLARSPSPLRGKGLFVRPGGASRLVTLWRTVRAVRSEAQEMRREAHRRYPFIGS